MLFRSMIAKVHDLRRIDILANGKLTSWDNAFALEADVNENFIMLQLDNCAVDEIALIELGQCAIDHGVELLIRNIVEFDDGRVLDFGQNGPLSNTRDPLLMMNDTYHARAQRLTNSLYNQHVSRANTYALVFTSCKSIARNMARYG